ncbi:hypothetical protein MJH12_04845, partial [bacterium]|nr:hypothetical protein [bacterium]
MKHLSLFLMMICLNFSFPLEGCRDDQSSQKQSIFYQHNEEIRDQYQYIKMPTAYYQLVVDQLGETDENGQIISFPTWKGIGLCMLNEEGKFIPYNISNQIYPSFSFLMVQEKQINLDGTIRAQAIYLKRILNETPKPSGEANWVDEQHYQAGKIVGLQKLRQIKSIDQTYKIQKLNDNQ